MKTLADPPLCLCGCGKKTSGKYNRRLRKYPDFIWGHFTRVHIPRHILFKEKTSEETRKKISLSHIGSGNPMFGISPWNKGKKVEEQRGEKNGNWKGGKPKCPICQKQLSQRSYKNCVKHRIRSNKGSNHYLWKGGITPLRKKMGRSPEYRQWREEVFKRDNYTCQICKKRSSARNPLTLNADHIKPFNLYPELRLSLENGRTLCLECHKNTDTYGIKSSKMIRKEI